MGSQSSFQSLAARFAPYLQEVRAFLSTCDVPFGSPQDIPDFAIAVSAPGYLHDGMSSIIRAIIYREQEEVSHLELLEVLLVAVGGLDVEEDAPGLDRAKRELSRFIGQAMTSLWGKRDDAVRPPITQDLQDPVEQPRPRSYENGSSELPRRSYFAEILTAQANHDALASASGAIPDRPSPLPPPHARAAVAPATPPPRPVIERAIPEAAAPQILDPFPAATPLPAAELIRERVPTTAPNPAPVAHAAIADTTPEPTAPALAQVAEAPLPATAATEPFVAHPVLHAAVVPENTLPEPPATAHLAQHSIPVSRLPPPSPRPAETAPHDSALKHRDPHQWAPEPPRISVPFATQPTHSHDPFFAAAFSGARRFPVPALICVAGICALSVAPVVDLLARSRQAQTVAQHHAPAHSAVPRALILPLQPLPDPLKASDTDTTASAADPDDPLNDPMDEATARRSAPPHASKQHLPAARNPQFRPASPHALGEPSSARDSDAYPDPKDVDLPSADRSGPETNPDAPHSGVIPKP